MRGLWLLSGMLLACGPGPNPETRLTELRVIQIVAEPPEVAPGELSIATVTVVDPEERGVEVLTWTCTDLGDGCLEAELPLELWTRVQSPVDEQVEHIVGVPGELAPLLEEIPALPTTVYALACEPGLCPVIDDIVRGRATGTELTDVDALMRGLPITGVSLASRFVFLSSAAPEERNANPVATPDFLEERLISDADSLKLRFVVDDDTDVVAYGLADAGGFSMPAEDVVDGAVECEWFAPKNQRQTRLYVAFEDGEGGAALWRGTVTLPE